MKNILKLAILALFMIGTSFGADTTNEKNDKVNAKTVVYRNNISMMQEAAAGAIVGLALGFADAVLPSLIQSKNFLQVSATILSWCIKLTIPFCSTASTTSTAFVSWVAAYYSTLAIAESKGIILT